jgi:AcrR family transcriptional regulator
MPPAPHPRIAPRRRPRQERSAQLVEDILEAAIRVLVREGARRFTTVRVAEEAGVSVGSLYQYFPNKAALLFRLQTDEWNETWGVVQDILADTRVTPLARLRTAVLAFFRSERQEAALRTALDDAGARVGDSPEARAFSAAARQSFGAFLAEILPDATPQELAFTSEFLMTSMGAAAEEITAEGRSLAEVDAWAKATAEMYCGYLEGLARRAS